MVNHRSFSLLLVSALFVLTFSLSAQISPTISSGKTVVLKKKSANNNDGTQAVSPTVSPSVSPTVSKNPKNDDLWQSSLDIVTKKTPEKSDKPLDLSDQAFESAAKPWLMNFYWQQQAISRFLLFQQRLDFMKNQFHIFPFLQEGYSQYPLSLGIGAGIGLSYGLWDTSFSYIFSIPIFKPNHYAFNQLMQHLLTWTMGYHWSEFNVNNYFFWGLVNQIQWSGLLYRHYWLLGDTLSVTNDLYQGPRQSISMTNYIYYNYLIYFHQNYLNWQTDFLIRLYHNLYYDLFSHLDWYYLFPLNRHPKVSLSYNALISDYLVFRTQSTFFPYSDMMLSFSMEQHIFPLAGLNMDILPNIFLSVYSSITYLFQNKIFHPINLANIPINAAIAVGVGANIIEPLEILVGYDYPLGIILGWGVSY